MKTAVEQQVLSTLGNLRREVESNGITEAASDMWAHALTLHRKAKVEESGVAIDDSDLPVFLRRQAG
jgi:hypothetical protein